MAPLKTEDFFPAFRQVRGSGETVVAATNYNRIIDCHGFDLLRKAFLVILSIKSTHQTSKKRNSTACSGVSPTALWGALARFFADAPGLRKENEPDI
jgi:hypothetical protein